MSAFEVKIGMLYQFLFFICAPEISAKSANLCSLENVQYCTFGTCRQDLGCTRAVKPRRSGTKYVPGVVQRGDQGQEQLGHILKEVAINAWLN